MSHFITGLQCLIYDQIEPHYKTEDICLKKIWSDKETIGTYEEASELLKKMFINLP